MQDLGQAGYKTKIRDVHDERIENLYSPEMDEWNRIIKNYSVYRNTLYNGDKSLEIGLYKTAKINFSPLGPYKISNFSYLHSQKNPTDNA